MPLHVMDQRYRAVLEIRAGVPVTEVADAFGVSQQAVHRWLTVHWKDANGVWQSKVYEGTI